MSKGSCSPPMALTMHALPDGSSNGGATARHDFGIPMAGRCRAR